MKENYEITFICLQWLESNKFYAIVGFDDGKLYASFIDPLSYQEIYNYCLACFQAGNAFRNYISWFILENDEKIVCSQQEGNKTVYNYPESIITFPYKGIRSMYTFHIR